MPRHSSLRTERGWHSMWAWAATGAKSESETCRRPAAVWCDSRSGDDGWYTIDGRRLAGKPTQSGIYINNGQKVLIK